MNSKFLFVFGTRPECIKMSPLILEAKRRQLDFKVCFTGQHMDMAQPILDFFEIKPDYSFGLMKQGQTLVGISLSVMEKLQAVIEANEFTHIIVQGDTTSGAIAGMTAFYNKLQVVHVEAGLRTYDLSSPWPEEFNRRLLSLASTWHFTPSSQSTENLKNENYNSKQIFQVGNTGIDALRIALEKINLLNDKEEIQNEKFKILVTLHRRENFGNEMQQIMIGIKEILNKYKDKIQVLWPIHQNPNVRKSFQFVFNELPENLTVIEPLGYIDFIKQMQKCDLIITDSGGIQEEAPFLGKPVLICRNNTERPEAVSCGSALIVGTSKNILIESIETMITKGSEYQNMSKARFPYGDGHASKKIFDLILRTEN